MKKSISLFLYQFPFSMGTFAQDRTEELQERIGELESMVSILRAKLVEVDDYKFLLYAILGVLIFLVILGTNASFKRKISRELNAIKKQLIEKYRESIAELPAETEEAVKNEIKKIHIYNRKIVELTLVERDFMAKDWLIKGLEAQYDNRFADSVEAFEKALSMDSEYSEACFSMAVSYGYMAESEKAIECYKKAIDYSPVFPEAWCNLGIELEKTDRNEEAVDAYNRAIEQRPDFPKAYGRMGTDLRKLEREEEAVQTYDKMGDTLLRMGREDEAVQAYSNMAIDLIKLGFKEKPEKPLIEQPGGGIDLEGLQNELKTLKIYYKQGNEYLKCDKHEEALEAFERIIQLHPEDLEARFCRAKVLLRMGREDDALRAFISVTHEDPTHVKAHYFLGKALMTMGNFKDAVKAFNRVIELKPDYPETYHKLACISAVEDNLEGALSNLRKYFELSLSGVEVYVERDALFEKYLEDRQFRKLLAQFRSPA